MKRTWMWSIFVMLAASIPCEGWAQSRTQVFTRGNETITVTDITPDSLNAGIGALLVKDGAIYAGTTNYLWISRDSGKTWVKRGKEYGLNVWTGWVKAIIAADSGHILASGGNGIFKSTDSGETWKHIFWAPPYGRITTFLVAKNKTIFAAQDRIFRSTDNGNTWQQIADSSLTWPYVLRMTQTSAGTILAGISSSGPTAGRGVLRSTNNGGTWSLADSGFTQYKNITGLAAYPSGFSRDVYAAVYLNGAWHSEDDGLSWKRVEGIPVLPGYAAAAFSPLGVFFGFDTRGTSKDALYRSYGADWKSVPGFSDYAVNAIAQFSASSIIVAGTGKIFMVSFDNPTGVDDYPLPPTRYTLSQNYPNPFNPSTTIEFSLPERGLVRLTVVNVLGQEVATLIAEERWAGIHKVTWNASSFPSGVYFYRLATKEYVAAKRMLLVK